IASWYQQSSEQPKPAQRPDSPAPQFPHLEHHPALADRHRKIEAGIVADLARSHSPTLPDELPLSDVPSARACVSETDRSLLAKRPSVSGELSYQSAFRETILQRGKTK